MVVVLLDADVAEVAVIGVLGDVELTHITEVDPFSVGGVFLSDAGVAEEVQPINDIRSDYYCNVKHPVE